MWNEGIDSFSRKFEESVGKWILLTKYTVDIFKGRNF